jgi:predicted branched-subunit amino acid permease
MALAHPFPSPVATPVSPRTGAALQPAEAQTAPTPEAVATTASLADSRADAVRTGLLEALPILAGIVPFGLVIGVAVGETATQNLAGWAGSFLLLAGAAHLAAVTMLDSGAGVSAILLTVLVINARLLVYSASLGPRFRYQPTWFRWIAPYFLFDQMFAMTWRRLERGCSPAYIRWYYLTAAVFLTVCWVATIGFGVIAGPVIPKSWELTFAPAALMMALLAPAVVNRPAVFAAIAGAGVAIALAGLPHGLNLLAGTAAGTITGLAAERIRS